MSHLIWQAVARAKDAAAKFSAPKFTFAKTEKSGDLYIYDDIGAGWFGEGVTPKGVADALAQAKGVETLNVYINSPGGNVFDGVAIYNQIRRFDARKVVHVDGIAASAASMIAMAGDDIRMAHNAQMMIHDAWGYAAGNAEEMRATADLLEKITDESVLPSYARTGQTVEQLRAWMHEETWMGAKDALARKFCDCIDGGESGDGDAGSAAAARTSPLVAAMAATHARIADLDRSRFLNRCEQSRAAASRSVVPGQPGKAA